MQLFVRWFVQYNPFFTLSALSVMGGVLLLSRALGDDADVALTGVLELYQWLVIATAGLLYRRLCEHRAGVILGVIALVFLVDPTLQLGALAATGAFWASALWVASFTLKWRALAWAFQLDLSTTGRMLPPVAAALVALLPNARVLGMPDEALAAFLCVSVFLLLVAGVAFPPTVTSRRALGEVGLVMFPRLIRAALGIGAAGVLFQAWNAALAIGPRALLPAVAAAAFVGVAAATSERRVWGLTFVGLILAVVPDMATQVSFALGGVGLLLAARRHAPRVFVAGVVMLVAAAALPTMLSGAEVPLAVLLVRAAATVVLVHALVRRRAFSALPAIGVMHLDALRQGASTLSPLHDDQWGALLVAVGFVLIPLGVWGHRHVSRWLDAVVADTALGDVHDDAAPPSSPAAIGGAV